MAEEEAKNQEQNAEATEAVEAGAEAAEEVAVAEPKAPSVLMPMLLSALITVVGVGVMVAVILPKQIAKAVAGAPGDKQKEGEGKEGEGKEGEGKEGEGKEGEGKEGESKEGEGEIDPNAAEDDPDKEVPIVPDGQDIVINPAGTEGKRYLLVEIFLLREDEKDTGFPSIVEKKTKQLQAVTVDFLTREDAQSLADPVQKDRLTAQLKLAYQEKLGSKHPIKKLLVSKWIMQ
tara:strand:+ start:663 stop:1358 length:696 start_codon:yes stop_codon:yes gene_type:complete